MKTPAIIVNFKTYEKASGDEALKLAFKCEKISNQEDIEVPVAVENPDLFRISKKVDIPIFAQHIDPQEFGSNTGKDIAETLKFNGADGVLINHSEDQMPIDSIEKSVKRAKENDLKTIVCVDVPKIAEKVSKFNPDFIAYEPPELIGGDVSVSEAKPELVKNAVESSSRPVLCGAGVKNGKDVEKAIELGTEGVLIASGVVKAKDPEEALLNLSKGTK